MRLTPSILYNYYQCPHKVWRDNFGPRDEEIVETNPFVKLLWDKGIQHEKNIIQKIYSELHDLSTGTIEERIARTKEAIQNKVKLIYQPVLTFDTLFGIPDLLELQANGDYFPIDIKSGQGFEGQSDFDDEQKQKKHYALQLCLYVEILTKIGLIKTCEGFIIDGDGEKIKYELDKGISPKNPQTFWEYYVEVKKNVIDILEAKQINEPAMSGICKLCSWYHSCKNWCKTNDDPTQIFYLGRSVRDKLKSQAFIKTVDDVINMDIPTLLADKKKDKTFLKGIGEGTLLKAQTRAKILKDQSEPVAYTQFTFPNVQYELFFDIEDDPTQDFVYLHGLYVRENGKEYFKEFVALTTESNAEEKAWSDFWAYIRSLPQNNFSVYYFSQHEKTTYFKLQKKHPNVISVEELTTFFENDKVLDLYTNFVLKHTDWPLGSYSIKELATYLGFNWRDETPSGALSIQWFNEYIKTGDKNILKRILEYNEDDCKATMILKDKLKAM